MNPGSFGASWKAFLMSQKPAYSAGVMGRYAADALAVIQRNNLECFPINLPHNEEPTEEWLASVNDEGPDPEQVPPDIESLSNEDYIAAMKELEERQKLLAFRKAVSEVLVWFVLFVLKRGFQANQMLACISVHERVFLVPLPSSFKLSHAQFKPGRRQEPASPATLE